MRHFFSTAGTIALLITHVASAQTQTPMKPTAPGTRGEPAWQGVVRASDGRTFITDGGLAIDATLVKTGQASGERIGGESAGGVPRCGTQG